MGGTGYGGWYHKFPIPFNVHVKIRLFDLCGFYAEDRLYPFFKYDYMLKVRLRMHEAQKVVKVQNPQSEQSDPWDRNSTDHSW